MRRKTLRIFKLNETPYEVRDKTLKVSNTAQDARNATHCKTMSTCKHARINWNSKRLTKGAFEIVRNRPRAVTQTLLKMPEHANKTLTNANATLMPSQLVSS